MKIIENPAVTEWDEICVRPSLDTEFLRGAVGNILDRVRKGGDAALLEFTRRFDRADIENIAVSEEEVMNAVENLYADLRMAIDKAAENIRAFHQVQMPEPVEIETMSGVRCWRKPVPIQKVGIYVPGGTAPLFSSVLMMSIPAGIAGCKEIILCSPPDQDGKIHPAILYAAHSTGVKKIYRAGGAQAIAAMAFGTETIPSVYKIFGPGNQYVTMAKQMVSEEGIAIDMPAGPSEVAVLADGTARPDFIAADLLSQAEHGPDSQVILVTTSRDLPGQVKEEIDSQITKLPRKEMAREALKYSKIIYFDQLDDALELINHYAAEHLIIQTKEPGIQADKIVNAGSVFLGPFTPEAAGDYASGTNHTLPTNGTARAYSGLNTTSFLKYITFQEITAAGLEQLGPVVEKMAEAEELTAHSNAIKIRSQR